MDNEVRSHQLLVEGQREVKNESAHCVCLSWFLSNLITYYHINIFCPAVITYMHLHTCSPLKRVEKVELRS